jgi:ribosomal protein S18 acetylase RimI-like enzyme
MTDAPAITASNIAIDAATEADASAIVDLWGRCELTRPWNDPVGDLARARKGPESTVLVGREGKTIVAAIMVGHDGHRGWVYYVAVDPAHRKKGHGRSIMTAAENWLRERGILKLQLMVRPENTHAQAFYETLDFDEQSRIVYAKWLDGRDPTP